MAAAPVPPGKVQASIVPVGGDSPVSPGVLPLALSADAGGQPNTTTMVFKVANAIVGALAYEVTKGQVTEDPTPAKGKAGKAKGKSKGKGALALPVDPSTPQKARAMPQHGRSPPTVTTASAPSPKGDDLEDGDDLSDEEDQSRLSPSASYRRSSDGTPNGGSFGKGGRGRPNAQGFRQQGGNGQGIRWPLPPQSGSLKALPARHVTDFLARVQEGKYDQAQEALRQVRSALGGRSRSKEAFGGMRALLHYLLEAYGCADLISEAVRALEEMKNGSEARLVSPAAFNAVLRGVLARSAFEQARFIVRNEMPRLGVTPNEASMNLLMDTAARSGPYYLEEAWNILEEMQSQNLRADKYTVSILTKHISERVTDKRRSPRGVALVEHFLVTQPDDVDEVLVNSLLDVFCRMGDMPRLEATLQKMKQYNIRGSAVTYGTIVKAYGRAGNIDKVLQAWSDMQTEGLEANAVTYGCMLDACVKCGHLEKAIQVFEIMRTQGLHRNTILYATLIKGFAKSKDPTAARLLYKEMLDEGVLCNVVVFNSLIDACVRASDLHAAAEVLQEMTNSGVRPDLITFSTLIKGYCSSGELAKAMRLQEELQARELECDEIVYNSLLEGCVKAGDLQLGLKLFGEMRQKGVRPSAVTFSILVKLLSRAGRLDLATHLVSKEMREMHGVAPTRMVWSCLVTCCVKARDLTRAAAALDLLDAEGAASGMQRAAMYAAVIEGSMTSGEVSTALLLVERAYNRAPPEDTARILLAMDLLKRVFETAGHRGPEAEAQAVLDSISRHLSEQVRSTLEEVLHRGSRRRGPGGHLHYQPQQRADAADFSLAAHEAAHFSSGVSAGLGPQQSAAWPGALPPVASHWQPNPYLPQHPGYFPGAEAAATAAAAAAYSATFPGWDPAVAAAAAAAGAAAVHAGWGWPPAGAEGYGYSWPPPPPNPFMPPEASFYPGWPYGAAQPWDDLGLQQWAATAAAATAPGYFQGAAAPCAPPLLSTPSAMPAVAVQPPQVVPFVPLEVATPAAPATPAAVRSYLKVSENERTPATTGGRTSLRSQTEDDDDVEPDIANTPLQKMLFASDSGSARKQEAQLSEHDNAGELSKRLLDGPPGLC